MCSTRKSAKVTANFAMAINLITVHGIWNAVEEEENIALTGDSKLEKQRSSNLVSSYLH